MDKSDLFLLIRSVYNDHFIIKLESNETRNIPVIFLKFLNLKNIIPGKNEVTAFQDVEIDN